MGQCYYLLPQIYLIRLLLKKNLSRAICGSATSFVVKVDADYWGLKAMVDYEYWCMRG